MKLTKQELQKIVKEQLEEAIQEGEIDEGFMDFVRGMSPSALKAGWQAGRQSHKYNQAVKQVTGIVKNKILPLKAKLDALKAKLDSEEKEFPELENQIASLQKSLNDRLAQFKSKGVNFEEAPQTNAEEIPPVQEGLDEFIDTSAFGDARKNAVYTKQLNAIKNQLIASIKKANTFKPILDNPPKSLTRAKPIPVQDTDTVKPQPPPVPPEDKSASATAAKSPVTTSSSTGTPTSGTTTAATPAAPTQSAETPPPAAGSTASTTPPVPTTTSSARSEEPSSATTSTAGDVAPVFTSNSDTASRDATAPETRTSPPSEGDESSPALEKFKKDTEEYEAKLAKTRAAQQADLGFTQRSLASIAGNRQMDPEQLRADSERQAKQASANTEFIRNNPTQNLVTPAPAAPAETPAPTGSDTGNQGTQQPLSKEEFDARMQQLRSHPKVKAVANSGDRRAIEAAKREAKVELGLTADAQPGEYQGYLNTLRLQGKLEEQSKKPVSYNKLYENWKRFTKG